MFAKQGMKVCSWCATEHVLAALCILNSFCTIQCGHCPSGWQEGPLGEDHCFAVLVMMNSSSNASSSSSFWNESEIACQMATPGAHLAALASVEELLFVDGLCANQSLAGGAAGGGCWVGGSQQESPGLYPNWTDCQVRWNSSAFPRAPTPSPNCSDATCSSYNVDGWCTVVVNRSLVWEDCTRKYPYVCGLVGGGSSCDQPDSQTQYVVIIIVVSSVIVTTTLGVTIWLLAYRRTKRRRRRRRRLAAASAGASGQGSIPWRVFEHAELEIFTDGFSGENRLGEGEEVNTYKGVLFDGSPVVVKKVMRPSFQGEKDFVAEMSKVGRLKHPNLVAMRGCCFHRGDGYIVYEYISNGSLEKWLHHVPPGARPLDWDTRIRIATGVAHSLSFLHDKVKPNLVLRNVRASTVLLDDEFDPHVMGVGLLNMVMGRETTLEPTVIVGTHGYLAPEFVYRNELTTKSDVFSFGVLLLELITGRRPTARAAAAAAAAASTAEGNGGGSGGDEPVPSSSEAPSIFEWAAPLVQAEAWTDLLDVYLRNVPNHSQVKKVVDLAYTCTQHVPSMRPRMSHVLYQLQEIHTAEVMVVPVDAVDTPDRMIRSPAERTGTAIAAGPDPTVTPERHLDDPNDHLEIREVDS